MMKTITSRIAEEDLKDLEQIEKDEQIERSEVIRKLLKKGISEWKIEKVLKLLREHKVSYRKAAKIAGITYSETLDLASKAGIDIGYTVEDLEDDLQRI